jgi:hypothetical protein
MDIRGTNLTTCSTATNGHALYSSIILLKQVSSRQSNEVKFPMSLGPQPCNKLKLASKAFDMHKGARMLQKGIKEQKIGKVPVIPRFQVCKLNFGASRFLLKGWLNNALLKKLRASFL